MATSNQEFRSLPITPNHGDTDCHFLKYKADHLNFICGTNSRSKPTECCFLADRREYECGPVSGGNVRRC